MAIFWGGLGLAIAQTQEQPTRIKKKLLCLSLKYLIVRPKKNPKTNQKNSQDVVLAQILDSET